VVAFSPAVSHFTTLIGIFLACGLGFPVPEEITLLSVGVLASTRQLPLFIGIMGGLCGILASDSTAFFLGRRLGPRVSCLPVLRGVLTESRVKWAESCVHNDGPIVCFIARFLPGLRVVIFTTCGGLGIKPQVFLAFEIMAALIEVSLWVFIGSWLGSNFIDATGFAHKIKTILIPVALLLLIINISWRLITRKKTEQD